MSLGAISEAGTEQASAMQATVAHER